jgi:predicted kinase
METIEELLTDQNLASLKGSNELRPAPGVQLDSLVPTDGKSPDWARCLEAIPDLCKLERTPQSPHFHGEGDVWTHSKMVVEAMLESTAWRQAGAADRFVLFMAALLHDIAKPATTTVDPVSGHIGQPGHSARGAVDARVLLWRAGVPFEQREAVCRLIAAHQVPFHLFKDNRTGRSPEFVLRKLSHEANLDHLAALARADIIGRRYHDSANVLDDIELFRELALEEGCLDRPRHFADEHTRMRYFAGANVHPDNVYHRDPGSEVIVMSGLPASGKDSWVASNAPGLPVVSFDDAREELGLKHGKNEGQAAHFATDKAKDLLRCRAPFVWNATHISRAMRKKSIDLLQAYHARITVVYLEQPEPVLLARNTRRDTSLPNAAIARMLHRWEVVLPSEAHEVRYLASQAAPDKRAGNHRPRPS